MEDGSSATLQIFWHRAGWLVLLLFCQSSSSFILQRDPALLELEGLGMCRAQGLQVLPRPKALKSQVLELLGQFAASGTFGFRKPGVAS